MEKSITCINCGESHPYKYCPYCGEKTETKKITLGNVLTDAFSSISNMDKGFLFNLKALTLYPKDIVFSYLKGKRSGILNPISFLVITISLYLVTETLFKHPVDIRQKKDKIIFAQKFHDIGYAFGKVIVHYFKFFWIFTVLFLANATKMLFWKFNYIEHITINSFIIGYATLLSIFGNLLYKIPLLFSPVLYIIMFILTYHIYNDGKSKFDHIIMSGISIFLFILQIFIVGITIGFIILYF